VGSTGGRTSGASGMKAPGHSLGAAATTAQIVAQIVVMPPPGFLGHDRSSRTNRQPKRFVNTDAVGILQPSRNKRDRQHNKRAVVVGVTQQIRRPRAPPGLHDTIPRNDWASGSGVAIPAVTWWERSPQGQAWRSESGRAQGPAERSLARNRAFTPQVRDGSPSTSARPGSAARRPNGVADAVGRAYF
jgi:hypothetical protein